MVQLVMPRLRSGVALAVLALGSSACTQTQVSDSASAAGGVLVETLVSTALDVAFDTNTSTRNLSDAELAKCQPRGDCLIKAHRKERATDAFIAGNRRVYDQLFEASEPTLAASLADWMDGESSIGGSAAGSASIMFRQPPLQVPPTEIDAFLSPGTK